MQYILQIYWQELFIFQESMSASIGVPASCTHFRLSNQSDL